MEEKNIGIVADEAIDLPEEIINNNDISLVKFKLDLQELEKYPGNIYEKMRQAEKENKITFAKTSQPSINDFAKAFQEKLKNYKEIICITISSKVSGTYNSALQAKKFLAQELKERVHIFDTLNGSAGEGLFVLKTLELIKNNYNIKEIIEKLEQETKKIKLLGLYENGKWLEASGRIPRFINKGAERMKIKPLFGFKDGKLAIAGIKRVKEMSKILFEEFEKNTQKIRQSGKKIIAGITHADNLEEAKKLKDLLSKINVEVIFSSFVCLPIGSHIGPGALVLSWNE
ncbi:MAG: DegV family protein [Candidatus Pacebacteria bacterium]|jgi:DegV family protein with EDD domain|nr:DegV family protein [Candidatus Paceibacterota bacterium]MDD5013194.1 DegV family protein [Candidatus Paceibacterota bacterium]MDD5752664.1 DegV family protein [Candidatus Paceibacterota bacterium]